ncbi:MAG: hypothetical protein M1839_003028 [Geoglossum umbratile]|nr:MAG: hypothetical protein M1839_003028 [Geoglossum umbratile]
MATIASFALALCMLLAAFVTFKCVTPPHPPPLKSGVKDRIGKLATQSKLTARRNCVLFVWIYHILLTITYPHPSPAICPHPDSLDPKLFLWGTHAVLYISMILVGGSIRLAAYKQLGENFTFQLAKPKMLVKHGLYRYVQHPSYIGQIVVFAGNLLLLTRPAGAIACWVPSILDIKYLDVLVWTVLIGVGVVLAGMRIRDEEDMLKKEFGKEWEEYHVETKRLIPGLL